MKNYWDDIADWLRDLQRGNRDVSETLQLIKESLPTVPDRVEPPSGITVREEQDVQPLEGYAVRLTKPEFIICEHGVKIGSISIDAPQVARFLALNLLGVPSSIDIDPVSGETVAELRRHSQALKYLYDEGPTPEGFAGLEDDCYEWASKIAVGEEPTDEEYFEGWLRMIEEQAKP